MSIAESEKQSWYFITKKYVRKIRAIRIIWAICVLVVIAVQIICFTSPYWVVNVKGPVIGYFGLWKTCRAFSGDFKCQGRLDDFANLLNVSAKAVTALYGLGVLILIGGALIMGFFAFLRASKVLRACAWMICLSGIYSLLDSLESRWYLCIIPTTLLFLIFLKGVSLCALRDNQFSLSEINSYAGIFY